MAMENNGDENVDEEFKQTKQMNPRMDSLIMV